jgi:hypothetical protein
MLCYIMTLQLLLIDVKTHLSGETLGAREGRLPAAHVAHCFIHGDDVGATADHGYLMGVGVVFMIGLWGYRGIGVIGV